MSTKVSNRFRTGSSDLTRLGGARSSVRLITALLLGAICGWVGWLAGTSTGPVLAGLALLFGFAGAGLLLYGRARWLAIGQLDERAEPTERRLIRLRQLAIGRLGGQALIGTALLLLCSAAVAMSFPGRLPAAALGSAALAAAILSLPLPPGRAGDRGWFLDALIPDALLCDQLTLSPLLDRFEAGWTISGRIAGLRQAATLHPDASDGARAAVMAQYAPAAVSLPAGALLKGMTEELRLRREGLPVVLGISTASALLCLLLTVTLPAHLLDTLAERSGLAGLFDQTQAGDPVPPDEEEQAAATGADGADEAQREPEDHGTDAGSTGDAPDGSSDNGGEGALEGSGPEGSVSGDGQDAGGSGALDAGASGGAAAGSPSGGEGGSSLDPGGGPAGAGETGSAGGDGGGGASGPLGGSQGAGTDTTGPGDAGTSGYGSSGAGSGKESSPDGQAQGEGGPNDAADGTSQGNGADGDAKGQGAAGDAAHDGADGSRQGEAASAETGPIEESGSGQDAASYPKAQDGEGASDAGGNGTTEGPESDPQNKSDTGEEASTPGAGGPSDAGQDGSEDTGASNGWGGPGADLPSGSGNAGPVGGSAGEESQDGSSAGAETGESGTQSDSAASVADKQGETTSAEPQDAPANESDQPGADASSRAMKPGAPDGGEDGRPDGPGDGQTSDPGENGTTDDPAGAQAPAEGTGSDGAAPPGGGGVVSAEKSTPGDANGSSEAQGGDTGGTGPENASGQGAEPVSGDSGVSGVGGGPPEDGGTSGEANRPIAPQGGDLGGADRESGPDADGESTSGPDQAGSPSEPGGSAPGAATVTVLPAPEGYNPDRDDLIPLAPGAMPEGPVILLDKDIEGGTPARSLLTSADRTPDPSDPAGGAMMPGDSDGARAPDLTAGSRAQLFAEEGEVPDEVRMDLRPVDTAPLPSPAEPSAPQQPLPLWIKDQVEPR